MKETHLDGREIEKDKEREMRAFACPFPFSHTFIKAEQCAGQFHSHEKKTVFSQPDFLTLIFYSTGLALLNFFPAAARCVVPLFGF